MENKTNTVEVELIVTRGISNSGKSTWAKKWVEEDPCTRRRVNRDTIREAGFTIPEYITEQEELVTLYQQGAVEHLLKSGKSVVVDDMFLMPRYVKPFYTMATKHGAKFSVREFPIDLETAITRATKRAEDGGLEVKPDVIRKMFNRQTNNGVLRALPDFSVDKYVSEARRAAYEASVATRYIADPELPDAIIVDMDGTMTMGIHPERGPFEWAKVGIDLPNPYVIALVKMFIDRGVKVLITSGRSDICRAETSEWLVRQGTHFDDMFMRVHDDGAPDDIVKSEIFEREIRGKYNLVGVFDDRARVCRLWHALGLPLFRVGDPDADF